MNSHFRASTRVIVPAFNEEACVGSVVRRLIAHGFEDVVVVDNGSSDGTAQSAREAGAKVKSLAQKGYGLACWTGGLDLPEKTEWLLYCNADASDDFSAYEQFESLAESNDLILGARTHPEDRKHLSMPQRFGNWLAPFLIRHLWLHRFADLGPQRAVRVDAYKKLNLQDRGFGWTVEMQIRAVEEGLRIAEIPVRNFPRPAGVSKISGNLRGSFLAGIIILETIWRLKLGKA